MSRACVLAFVCVVMCGAYLSANERSPVKLPLYYDPATGDVTFDTSDIAPARFIGYGLKIPFNGWLVENFELIMPSPWIDFRPSDIGESNLSGIDPGVYSIGNVMPVGLSVKDFQDYFGPMPEHLNGFEDYNYTAFGLSTGVYHVFDPIYGASPHPPINDPMAWVAPEWATEATLSYVADQGEVLVNTDGPNGGAIVGFSFSLNEPVLDVSEFRAIEEDGMPVVGPDTVAAISLKNYFPAGSHSLGNILPVGLSSTEWESLIDDATFIGEPGKGGQAFAFDSVGRAFATTYVVPEPRFHISLLIVGWFIAKRNRNRPEGCVASQKNRAVRFRRPDMYAIGITPLFQAPFTS